MSRPEDAPVAASMARPILLVAFCLLLLSAGLVACVSQVDEIRMKIDKDEKGALVTLISAPLSGPELPDGEWSLLSPEELRESTGFREFNEYTEQLSRCAITNRIYQRQRRVRLDLRAPFEDVDDLNSIFSCGAQVFEEPGVSFERHDGFIRNTYITHFEITQPALRCDGADGDCRDSETYFPRVLTLTVPGKVDRVNNFSDLVGLTVQSRQVDDDTVRIEVALLPAAQYREANLRYFHGRREQLRRDVLRIQIVSKELNYDLGTIVSVFGLIVGSGLFFRAAPWLYSRFKKKKAPA